MVSQNVGCFLKPSREYSCTFCCCLQIHVYLIFCILTVITSILMFWLVMPIIVNDNREVSWNMFFGSFLGLVAITFVVSMKGSFVAFKASFFQYNCCNKVPQLQVSESLQAQREIVNPGLSLHFCKFWTGLANTPNLAYFTPKLFRWLHWGYRGSHFDSRNFR